MLKTHQEESDDEILIDRSIDGERSEQKDQQSVSLLSLLSSRDNDFRQKKLFLLSIRRFTSTPIVCRRVS